MNRRRLEVRISGLTEKLAGRIINYLQSCLKTPKIRDTDVIYRIKGVRYSSSPEMVEKAEELVNEGCLSAKGMKEYLAGMWN